MISRKLDEQQHTPNRPRVNLDVACLFSSLQSISELFETALGVLILTPVAILVLILTRVGIW